MRANVSEWPGVPERCWAAAARASRGTVLGTAPVRHATAPCHTASSTRARPAIINLPVVWKHTFSHFSVLRVNTAVKQVTARHRRTSYDY